MSKFILLSTNLKILPKSLLNVRKFFSDIFHSLLSSIFQLLLTQYNILANTRDVIEPPCGTKVNFRGIYTKCAVSPLQPLCMSRAASLLLDLPARILYCRQNFKSQKHCLTLDSTNTRDPPTF